MRREEFKKIILPCLVFSIGMLSVSIANVFGNHYGFVAILAIVLSSIYVYDVLDNGINIKDRSITLSLMGVIVFFELLFFIVNDLFNVSVYSVGNLGFFGICVLLSQVVSIVGIIYLLINIVLNNRKIDVEIMENDKQTFANDTKKENVVTAEKIEEVDKAEEVEEKQEESKEEVRFIQNKNRSQNVPFMEEEN